MVLTNILFPSTITSIKEASHQPQPLASLWPEPCRAVRLRLIGQIHCHTQRELSTE